MARILSKVGNSKKGYLARVATKNRDTAMKTIRDKYGLKWKQITGAWCGGYRPSYYWVSWSDEK